MREGRVLLLVNPASQRGKGAKLAKIAYELLVEWLGADTVDMLFTQRPGHATELAAHTPKDRYATLIALGGDGLVHETVNGLMRLPRHSRPVFGLVPAGSGNDFAQTIGMSCCAPDAVVQFLTACERSLDIGCCNGEHFSETISFGLDAAIALDTLARRERTGEQGMRLYLASGLGQLLNHLDTYRFTGVLDGSRSIAGAVHMFAVQNGPTYGGGFRICPQARADDGMLDICYADAPMSVPVATFKFLRAKNGRHVGCQGIHFERASRIQLSFDKRPPCQIDGEPHLADSYDISIERKAIDVLCAAESR